MIRQLRHALQQPAEQLSLAEIEPLERGGDRTARGLGHCPPGVWPAVPVAIEIHRRFRAPRQPRHVEREPPIEQSVVGEVLEVARAAVQQVAQHFGAGVDVIHMVGGGSQNALLCRLTTDAPGLPVTASPVEPTALGNVLVQARACGAVPASLTAVRSQIARSPAVRRFEPALSPKSA